jgi:hypothetical protein
MGREGEVDSEGVYYISVEDFEWRPPRASEHAKAESKSESKSESAKRPQDCEAQSEEPDEDRSE